MNLKTYKKYIKSIIPQNEITEKQLSFDGKVYPKNGNVVILAGGAGSGKSFSIAHEIGLEGKVIDNDKLRSFMIKSERFKEILKNEYNIEITDDFFKNPENANNLYKVFKEKNIVNKYLNNLFDQIKVYSEKPNLIFDKVLETVESFNEICDNLLKIGYQKNNIHLVWVLTPIEEARANNANRSRTVREIVITGTHFNAAKTMNYLYNNSSVLREKMDGDWYVIFNSRSQDNNDSNVEKTNEGKMFVKDFNYLKIKDAGADVKKESDFITENEKNLYAKISQYVPKEIDPNDNTEKSVWR